MDLGFHDTIHLVVLRRTLDAPVKKIINTFCKKKRCIYTCRKNRATIIVTYLFLIHVKKKHFVRISSSK